MRSTLFLGCLIGVSVAWVRTRDTDPRTTLREAFAYLYPRRPTGRRRLPRLLLRAAASTATVGVSGNTIVPSRITVGLHPDEAAMFDGAVDWLANDVAQGLRDLGQRRGWDVPANLTVKIVADPERLVGSPRAAGVFGPTHIPTARYPEDRARWAVRRTDEKRSRVAGPQSTRQTSDDQNLPTERATVMASLSHPMFSVSLNDRDPVMHVLTARGLSIGRDPEADITLTNRKASRRHCTLRSTPDGYVIDDDSMNGTIFDEVAIRGTFAVGSDFTIRVGTDTLKFVSVASPVDWWTNRAIRNDRRAGV